MHGLVTDEYFDLEKTKEYILSIQVSLGGFSFSVIHPNENRLLALQHTPGTISNERFISRRFNEWLESEKLLQQSYKETRIIVSTEKFTLVPEMFYNEQKKREIMHPVLETDATGNIGVNRIETFETRLLFAIPPQLETTLDHATLMHPVKLLIENRPKITAENGLILWFNSGGCYLVLYKANQLLLTNYFKITHENDVIYYVLTTFKQLGVAPGKTELQMGGEMAEKESIQNLLKKYFSSVNFLKPKGEIQINTEKFNTPMHPFIHLFI
jgi:hypothetical protein